jgi:hypothetical protein
MCDEIKAQFDPMFLTEVVKVKEYMLATKLTTQKNVVAFLCANGWLKSGLDRLVKRHPSLANVQMWLKLDKTKELIEVRIGIAEVSARYPNGYSLAVLGEYTTGLKTPNKRVRKNPHANGDRT